MDLLQLNLALAISGGNPPDWWKGPVNRHREMGHRTKNLFTHFKQGLCPSADNWVHPPHDVPKGNYFGTTTFPMSTPASSVAQHSSALQKYRPALSRAEPS